MAQTSGADAGLQLRPTTLPQLDSCLLLWSWQRRVDIGFFDGQLSEPTALKRSGRSGRAARAVSHEVFGNRIVRSDHLEGERVHPEAFLPHLADHGVHTPVR